MLEEKPTQVYKIHPNNPNDKRKGFWGKFLKAFGNMILSKLGQSERFVEAKVKREEAEAAAKQAEAISLMAGARKVQAETRKIDAETEMIMRQTVDKTKALEQEKLQDEELELMDVEELKKRLEEKMRVLRLTKGTEFNFDINDLDKDLET